MAKDIGNRLVIVSLVMLVGFSVWGYFAFERRMEKDKQQTARSELESLDLTEHNRFVLAEQPADVSPYFADVCPPCPETDGPGAELEEAKARIQQLETRLAFAKAIEQGYQGQLFGTKQTWPTDTPAHLSSAGFQDVLNRSLADCQVAADLVDFDCSEAPCIAQLRPRQKGWIWDLIRECSAWGEHFKRVPLWIEFEAPCVGGQTEKVVLLSPSWTDFPGEREAMIKRLASRNRQIQDNWRCVP